MLKVKGTSGTSEGQLSSQSAFDTCKLHPVLGPASAECWLSTTIVPEGGTEVTRRDYQTRLDISFLCKVLSQSNSCMFALSVAAVGIRKDILSL